MRLLPMRLPIRRVPIRRVLVPIALAAAMGLTACGGGSSDTKATGTTTPTAPPPTTALSGNDQASTPFCKLARTYTEKYAGLLSSLGDPVKLKAASTDAESAIRQAKDTAPPEIKSDVSVVANTAGLVLASLQKNNFVLANTPPADLAKLQDPGFQASLTKLTTYGQAHCGLS